PRTGGWLEQFAVGCSGRPVAKCWGVLGQPPDRASTSPLFHPFGMKIRQHHPLKDTILNEPIHSSANCSHRSPTRRLFPHISSRAASENGFSGGKNTFLRDFPPSADL